ncbi:MAG: arginase [Planctomycetes bacterium]|nr:arginase [Planctomycetota bacterium]
MNRKIAVIGVPIDLGANRRGVDMGPSALRVTGLTERIRTLKLEVRDFGDIDVPLPEECEVGEKNKKFAEDIQDVCNDVCEKALAILRQEWTPVFLGGDHSLAMGSIAATSKFFREKNQKIGIVWFDAHGDMNTPESTNSGNVHGMPLAHVLGLGDPGLAGIGGFSPKADAARCALVGVRDLDDREKKLVHDSGVRVFTMKDIDKRGVSSVIEEALAAVGEGTAGIHVSFDIDACDPSVAPGVGTPKKGGLNYREAHLCLEMIADAGRMIALDMVEVNPIFDTRNQTAEFAGELILSALGKSIF